VQYAKHVRDKHVLTKAECKQVKAEHVMGWNT